MTPLWGWDASVPAKLRMKRKFSHFLPFGLTLS